MSESGANGMNDFTGFASLTNNKTMNSMGTNNIILIYPNSTTMLNNPIKLNLEINKSPLKKYIDADEIEIRTNKRKNIMVVETKRKHSEIQEEILKIDKIGSWEVECKIPAQNLSRNGVIGPITLEADIEDIYPAIKVKTDSIFGNDPSPKILKLERLFKKEQNQWVASESIKVTFEGTELPRAVAIFQSIYKVRPFVFKPLQCYNCQGMSHTAGSCKRRKRCLLCSKEHDRKDCPNPNDLKCANCHGPHAANSQECKHYKLAKEIEQTRATENESYAVARNKVLSKKQGIPEIEPNHSNSTNRNNFPNLSQRTQSLSAAGTTRPNRNISYRNALVPNHDCENSMESAQTPQTGEYVRDKYFFDDLKKCLLEVLKEIKTGKEHSQAIDDAVQSTFFGNKRRKSDSETSEFSHPSQVDDGNMIEPQILKKERLHVPRGTATVPTRGGNSGRGNNRGNRGNNTPIKKSKYAQ